MRTVNSRSAPKTRGKQGVRQRRAAPAQRPGRSFRSPARSQKNFGKRGTAPTGYRARMAAIFSFGGPATRLFAGAAALLLVSALTYGLVMGGHVAAFAAGTVEQSKALVAAAGLRVEEVTVEGRNRTAPQDILSALGVARGQFIFDLDIEAARTEIERLEWVERAVVSRRLPDTIHVQIEEREPFAVWQRGGRLSLVDRRGDPITDFGLEAFAHLPLVVGHGAQRNAAALMDELMARPSIAARVQAAVRVSDRRWNLKLQNGIEVRLPATGLGGSLGKLARLDAENGLLSREILAVDLRVPGRISILIDSESAAQRRAAFKARAAEGGRDA